MHCVKKNKKEKRRAHPWRQTMMKKATAQFLTQQRGVCTGSISYAAQDLNAREVDWEDLGYNTSSPSASM
jgi:hypothetical protein